MCYCVRFTAARSLPPLMAHGSRYLWRLFRHLFTTKRYFWGNPHSRPLTERVTVLYVHSVEHTLSGECRSRRSVATRIWSQRSLTSQWKRRRLSSIRVGCCRRLRNRLQGERHLKPSYLCSLRATRRLRTSRWSQPALLNSYSRLALIRVRVICSQYTKH